jgi:murein DD-endopeptidase MepM/ murein hydrolase activator NlpD
VVSSVVRWVVREEVDQRDRFVRENLDVLARKVGEMQAKVMQLESLGERVSGLAGLSPGDVRAASGRGGIFVPGPPLSGDQLDETLRQLELSAERKIDLLTVVESRLFDQKVLRSLLPTQVPVVGVDMGSPFGWRIDPFTGKSALHTGLDFPGEPGTPISAAAGGIVVTQEVHPAYGNLIEIDHGNDLVSRYAHASRVLVRKGDLVRRGQRIAEIGSTGRSTGPHLHFEVLVRGVQQDPQKFLDAGKRLPQKEINPRLAQSAR